MATVVRAIYDGSVLRPVEPLSLELNQHYVLSIEPAPAERNGSEYPLEVIRKMAVDMGVADLADRHTEYA